MEESIIACQILTNMFKLPLSLIPQIQCFQIQKLLLVEIINISQYRLIIVLVSPIPITSLKYPILKIPPANGLLVQGSVGIGITGPSAKLEVSDSSTQLRLSHTTTPTSNYCDFTVSSAGDLT